MEIDFEKVKFVSYSLNDYEIMIKKISDNSYAAFCPQLNAMAKNESKEKAREEIARLIYAYLDYLSEKAPFEKSETPIETDEDINRKLKNEILARIDDETDFVEEESDEAKSFEINLDLLDGKLIDENVVI